jgi:dsRNA-specific ribonuclease
MKENSGSSLWDNSNKFIRYSFHRNFRLTSNCISIYEPPKILGDVFEAIIGGIFIDGGIEEVIRVLKPILSPLVLFVAKHSKQMLKEPKEDLK